MSNKTLLSSIALISILSLLSKLLGFFREGVIAYYIGTSQESDIFFLVFGIFNYVTSAIGMSLGISFLPIFVKLYSEKGKKMALHITWRYMNQMLLLFIPCGIIIYLFSDDIAILIAPTYTNAALQIVSAYIKLFSLVFYFTLVSYILFDVLNGEKKYGIRQLTGMLFSVFSIVFIVLFHSYYGVDVLVYSFLVATVVQFLILFFLVFHKKKYVYLKKIYSFSGMKEVYISILPVLLGTGVWYIRNVIDRIISTTLDIGAVSALNYSGVLFSLINTLIIASLVTVFYTEMSAKYAVKDYQSVSHVLNNGLVILTLILCPIMIIGIFSSSDIISFLLYRGKFTQSSVSLTAMAFSMYIIGAPFYAMRDILTRYCYIVSDKRTPVKNSLIAFSVNVPLSYFLAKYYGIGGITFASSFVSILLTFLLCYDIRKKDKSLFSKGLCVTLLKILLASVSTAIVLYFTYEYFFSRYSPFIKILFCTLECLLVYCAFLLFFRCKEFIVLLCKLKIF